MAKFEKPAASSSNSNLIPVQTYVLKITEIDNKDSKAGQPMLALDCVFVSPDVVNDGYVIGGKAVQRQYFSLSEKAASITFDRLRKMGVSEEDLDLFTDTADKEWIDRVLKYRCFQAIVANEELYRANDGRSYTTDGLKYENSKRSNKLDFILDGAGQPIRCGVRYVVTDITGAATADGNPY